MLSNTDDPDPIRRIGSIEGVPLLVLCEHASNAIPKSLGTLGLADNHLNEHIAWDIGAARVAERILELSGGFGIFGGFSRLVIDCNRPLWNPGLAPAVSDGVAIPANSNLPMSELGERIEQIYLPFHYAVVRALATYDEKGIKPFVLSVHSCTPQMNGVSRPWPVGVAHSSDERFSRPLMEALQGNGEFEVGDNQPYAVDADDYTIVEHALKLGLSHSLIEIRQDLIGDEAGAIAWGGRVHSALKEISVI